MVSEGERERLRHAVGGGWGDRHERTAADKRDLPDQQRDIHAAAECDGAFCGMLWGRRGQWRGVGRRSCGVGWRRWSRRGLRVCLHNDTGGELSFCSWGWRSSWGRGTDAGGWGKWRDDQFWEPGSGQCQWRGWRVGWASGGCDFIQSKRCDQRDRDSRRLEISWQPWAAADPLQWNQCDAWARRLRAISWGWRAGASVYLCR